MVYLENGNRFWKCEAKGNKVVTSFGVIGNAGRTTTKDLGTQKDAEECVETQAETKRSAGYQDATEDDDGKGGTKQKSTSNGGPTNNSKKRKAAPAPAPAASQAPSSTKKGLSGHAAPGDGDDVADGIDSGVAGIDSALASRAQLHESLFARLALVDTAKNSDKYYILQVLVDAQKKSRSRRAASNPKSYHLFTRWGRTGTGGQAKLDGPYSNEGDCQKEFEKIFKSKTGVEWSKAVPGTAPKSGKYEYLAVSDGDGNGVWYYYLTNDPQGKVDGWYPYDDDNCKEVEDLFGSYEAAKKPKRLAYRVITSESSSFQYMVDLLAMQQTNISSGTVRPIQRTDDGKAPTGVPGNATPAAATSVASTKKAPPPAPAPAPAPAKASKKAAPAPVPSAAAAAAAASAKPAAKKVGSVDKAASSRLQNGEVIEDAMLNQTNLGANNNKFYKLQVIKTTSGYTLFTKWGRVGEDGQKQEQGPFNDEDKAVKEFAKKFRSKTGNSWEAYQDDKDSFKPKKGKYTVVEMDHDADAEEIESKLPTDTPCKLPIEPCKLDKETKSLVDLIFDEDMFKSAMADMNLDPRKLPLGALSQTQIAKGLAVLEKIQEGIEQRAGHTKLMDLTSEFYTLIPHAFGRQRGPVLNTADAVQKKFDMMNTLTDIEAAQAMQKKKPKSDDDDDDGKKTQEHPSDVKYKTLATDLVLVDPKKDDDYKLIEQYFDNTKENGGYRGNMKLKKVWRVDRHDEDKRFAAHDNVAYRKLLWHGTNVAVVAAILKSGLRIMPHSGGRVGRGIYLADQHQKSAWYTRSAQGTTIMFLVEAALGKQHEIQRDDSSLVRAPAGTDSVLARGKTQPEDKHDKEIEIDGKNVIMPIGKPTNVTSAKNSYFDHNEFLIYKESQHRIRYVLTFSG